MIRTGIASAVITVAIAAGAVSARTQDTARPEARTGQLSPRPSANAAPTDSRAFINTMAVAGMAEVQLGKLATERASSADVKAFGQMMVTDHTKANEELKQIASRLDVQLPTQLDDKHRSLAAKLSTLKGAEFDREYMTAMVGGHEEVANTLRSRTGGDRSTSTPATPSGRPSAAAGSESRAQPGNAGGGDRSPRGSAAVGTGGSGSGEDALNQWAMKTLPTVQQHLERARALQQKTAR